MNDIRKTIIWQQFGAAIDFAELQLYNMRHVHEHAAQLSLFLWQKVGSAPDWVTQAESRAA